MLTPLSVFALLRSHEPAAETTCAPRDHRAKKSALKNRYPALGQALAAVHTDREFCTYLSVHPTSCDRHVETPLLHTDCEYVHLYQYPIRGHSCVDLARSRASRSTCCTP